MSQQEKELSQQEKIKNYPEYKYKRYIPFNEEQLKKEQEMKNLYIKQGPYELPDEKNVTIEEFWNSIFKNQSVPIFAAQIGFRYLIGRSILNDEVLSKFVAWLSKDNKTVSIKDLQLLFKQLEREEYINPADKANYLHCGPKYYRGLACVAKLIYDISLDPGFHNKLSVDTNYMKPCEYIFRKTDNEKYLFTFEFKNKANKIIKYGIKLSRYGENLFIDNKHQYDTFEKLRDYLVTLPPCESGMSPFKV